VSAAPPHRRAPRPLSLAIDRLRADLAPATPLARIQGCWSAAAGETVAAAARPTAERAGVVTVSCEASVWAAELQLMGPELVARLNEQLGEPLVSEVRCRTGT
jgi:predicted nucleic acid-binding Zn ribbon protein